MTKKELLLACVDGGAMDIFYYNRGNDDELSVEDVSKLIESGEVTLKEILDTFEARIRERFPNIK